MTQILLIEDDLLIVGPVIRALEAAGYEAKSAIDGKMGIEMALQMHPDLVLLDIMLPHMSGWDVCKELRARSTVPIVMLTALNEEVERILGLELGADDYITKPFSTRELLARIKAALRRVELDMQHQTGSSRISILDITLDMDTRRVHKKGQELQLRYKEFELLSLLMMNAGQVVTRAEIFDKVWGTDWLGDMRTLDVHIRWLREKLEDDPGQPVLIQTVRGIGYRFATS